MTATLRTSSWLTAVPPSVAIEIASHRVTVVEVARSGARTALSRQATEALAPGLVVPALSGTNIHAPAEVSAAIERACLRAGTGVPARAALVLPDSVARVSLLPLEQVPARASDLDQLLRWQIRKATPFPLEQAQISHFPVASDTASTTFATVVARLDVIREYETVVETLGVEPGLVDLASFNVMNAVMGAGACPAGDWLLVHLASEATTLAILRGDALLFYRHRTAVDTETLGSLVHQTAMYHEDRLGGGTFAGVWVSGAGEATDDARRQLAERLRVEVQVVDARTAAERDVTPAVSFDQLDALAAPIGVLIRGRAA
jgi:Tfp pilus assembly PilM family ATPase